MKRYYISNPNSPKGFDEVTEAEFYAILGDEITRPYASKVYRGELSIDEVPDDLQEAVMAVVNKKIERFGEYNKQEVPAQELKNMIEEVV